MTRPTTSKPRSIDLATWLRKSGACARDRRRVLRLGRTVTALRQAFTRPTVAQRALFVCRCRSCRANAHAWNSREDWVMWVRVELGLPRTATVAAIATALRKAGVR